MSKLGWIVLYDAPLNQKEWVWSEHKAEAEEFMRNLEPWQFAIMFEGYKR